MSIAFKITDVIGGEAYGSAVPETIDAGFEILLYELDTPEKYALMQFTGLHDKNGSGIFEGDVLKADHWATNWIVKFDSKKARFNCIVNRDGHANDYIPGESVAVIGNIYQNPELI
jgi:uncharacterized phage protein (TIGR01671 family)